MAFLRTILALTRLGRLPSIWSDCLAGWWLGGGDNLPGLAWLLCGATLLYLGGVCLHDAFDVSFDRQHRRTRPIPAGMVGLKPVWRAGVSLTVLGALLLFFVGRVSLTTGLVLALFMVLFNAFHRMVAFGPALLGACRFLLYLLGASVAAQGITGWSIWCGLALMVFCTGVGLFENWQRRPGPFPVWPVSLLAAPVLLALVMNAGRFWEAGSLLSVVLVLWVARSLRPTFWGADRNPAETVPGLRAGVVMVDWLAACPATVMGGLSPDGPMELNFVFIALFLLTLVFQKAAPES